MCCCSLTRCKHRAVHFIWRFDVPRPVLFIPPPIFRSVVSDKFFFLLLLLHSFLTFVFRCRGACVRRSLTHRKPSHADNNIQAPLLTTWVFKSPHAVPVHIPVRARRRVHTALADFAGTAGSGFVDDALLDNGAVYREAVGRGWWCICGWFFFGGGGDNEGFEDGVLFLCVNWVCLCVCACLTGLD